MNDSFDGDGTGDFYHLVICMALRDTFFICCFFICYVAVLN